MPEPYGPNPEPDGPYFWHRPDRLQKQERKQKIGSAEAVYAITEAPFSYLVFNGALLGYKREYQLRGGWAQYN